MRSGEGAGEGEEEEGSGEDSLSDKVSEVLIRDK